MAYNAAMGQPAVTQTPVQPAVALPSVTVPTVTTVPAATPVTMVPPTIAPAAAAATPAASVAPVAIQNPATSAAVAHHASIFAAVTAPAAAPEASGAAAPVVKAAAGPAVIPGVINGEPVHSHNTMALAGFAKPSLLGASRQLTGDIPPVKLVRHSCICCAASGAGHQQGLGTVHLCSCLCYAWATLVCKLM